jgi:hypothetical protein
LRLKQRNISNIGKPFKSKFKLRLNIAQTGVPLAVSFSRFQNRAAPETGAAERALY